jgi:site-specific DNA-cytosine methylase
MPVQVEGEGGELIRIRSLTITESLTLQGFPDGFDLTAAPLKGDRWIMVGNAVCPPVAEAVMRGLLNPLETLEGWIE